MHSLQLTLALNDVPTGAGSESEQKTTPLSGLFDFIRLSRFDPSLLADPR